MVLLGDSSKRVNFPLEVITHRLKITVLGNVKPKSSRNRHSRNSVMDAMYKKMSIEIK